MYSVQTRTRPTTTYMNAPLDQNDKPAAGHFLMLMKTLRTFRCLVIPIGFSLLPLGKLGVAQAQPCPDSSSYFIQYKTAHADQVKCGFGALTNDDLPRLHLYHTKISKENWSLHYNNSFQSTTNSTGQPSCPTVIFGP